MDLLERRHPCLRFAGIFAQHCRSLTSMRAGCPQTADGMSAIPLKNSGTWLLGVRET